MKKYTLGDDLSYVEQQKQQLILQRLRTIFYTKIIVNIGPGGDFGRISEESQLMTEGKLMIFFRQFGILDEKIHHQNQIYQQTILRQSQVMISNYTHKWWLKNTSQEQPLFKKLPFKMLHAEFLKISNHSKILIFDQFLLLLNRVAQLMFSSYLNFDEKFYQFLGIDSSSYKLKMKQVHFPFNCKPSQIMLSPLNSIQKKRSESLFMNDYSILKQPENNSQSIILSTEKTTETDGVQNKIKRRLPKKLSSIVREREERKNALKSKIEEYETNNMKRSHSQISLNYYDYFEMQKNQQNFERKVFKKH